MRNIIKVNLALLLTFIGIVSHAKDQISTNQQIKMEVDDLGYSGNVNIPIILELVGLIVETGVQLPLIEDVPDNQKSNFMYTLGTRILIF